MTTELFYLVLMALMTTVQFLVYTNNLILKYGLGAAVGNRDASQPLAPWAERAKRAHANAVENIVIFTIAVLVAHLLNKHNAVTTTSAMLYFWARLAYIVVYTAGIVWLRTLIWTVSWVCAILILLQALM